MVRGSQVHNLLLNLRSYAQTQILRTRLVVDQILVSQLLVPGLPVVERLPSYPKGPTRLGYIPACLDILQNPQLSLDIPLCFRHPSPPHSGNLLSDKKVSTEVRSFTRVRSGPPVTLTAPGHTGVVVPSVETSREFNS